MCFCNRTNGSGEELLEITTASGYPTLSCSDSTVAIAELEKYRTVRHLAIWHDHSTILWTGYILFAIWVVYDPVVFLTDNEYTTQSGLLVNSLQEVIKEPVIYMIAPSNSSPDEQLALVPDRVECLQQLSQPIESHSAFRYMTI